MTTNNKNTTKDTTTKDENVMGSIPKNLMIPVLLLSLRGWIYMAIN